MSDKDNFEMVMEAASKRREQRREFLKTSGLLLAAGGSMALAGCSGDDEPNFVPTPPPPVAAPPPPAPPPAPPPPPPIGDADILNFALNLEYLEAQFYAFAATGAGLPANLLTGVGAQGAVTGGRQVTFTDTLIGQYAREIAADERQHVVFLRRVIGAAAVAQPALDIGSEPNGAFSSAARAAGLVGPGVSFDPYANENNFLLGAYIFEDVGVTAYKGASPLIASRTFVEAAAGILAAEAYHAGLVRTVLFGRGIATPALVDATEAISNARDSLDGPTDLDQGVRTFQLAGAPASNIVPTDANGLAFSRTTAQVLNIVFNTRMAVTQGGFFPAGINIDARLRSSGAN